MFKAALTLVLAEFTYRQLSEEQQRKVDDTVIDMIDRSGTEKQTPTLAYYALPEAYRNGLIAAALKQLGIPPAVEGERWSFMGNPFFVDFADPRFDSAIKDAVKYLRGKGVKLYPDLGDLDLTS
jgi:hypothetical protein